MQLTQRHLEGIALPLHLGRLQARTDLRLQFLRIVLVGKVDGLHTVVAVEQIVVVVDVGEVGPVGEDASIALRRRGCYCGRRKCRCHREG